MLSLKEIKEKDCEELNKIYKKKGEELYLINQLKNVGINVSEGQITERQIELNNILNTLKSKSCIIKKIIIPIELNITEMIMSNGKKEKPIEIGEQVNVMISGLVSTTGKVEDIDKEKGYKVWTAEYGRYWFKPEYVSKIIPEKRRKVLGVF